MGDYDGDGKTDIVVARQTAGQWHWFLRLATGTEVGPVPFGFASAAGTDTLLPGDFDGDGDFDLNVIRTQNGGLYWFNYLNDGTIQETQWGLAGDTPLTGYFGGAGENDRVVVRTVNGGLVWYIQHHAPEGIQWGLANDRPMVADVTGDGIDDLIVVRTEGGFIVWYIRSLAGDVVTPVLWGRAGDSILTPADFNGDGRADLVVTRDEGGFRHAFIYYSAISFTQAVPFGLTGDLSYIGKFTQNSLAELAVYRTTGSVSQHFVRFAQVDFVANVSFGLSGDTVVAPEGGALAAVADSSPGCSPTPGTAGDFLDGVGKGALWKPVSEGVASHSPVVLLPISYCGAAITIFGADGSEVSGVQRVKCGGNGNRAHFWIQRTASQMTPFAPLTVRVINDGVTECRSVPNPGKRYD